MNYKINTLRQHLKIQTLAANCSVLALYKKFLKKFIKTLYYSS